MGDHQAPELWLPTDLTLPFFAYGLFMPGQLAYFQLQDLATSTAAAVSGQLFVRDGVPFLAPTTSGHQVEGALVAFAPADAEEGYRRIAAMEPKNLYYWDRVDTDGATANALLGKSPEQGRPLEWPDWDGWEDPLFRDALEIVERRTASARRLKGYEALFERQMAYMLLWSGIERYLSLRYSLGSDVNQKMRRLAQEPGFKDALRRHVIETREMRISTNPKGKETLDPNDPDRSVRYYYGVRSNVTHRGKTAAEAHGEIQQSALDELLPIFRDVLKAARREAQQDTLS